MQNTADLFRFEPAEDESTDAQYVLIENENWTVQVSPYAGGYGVNEYGYDNPGDEGSLWMADHGIYRSKAKALDVCLTKARATA